MKKPYVIWGNCERVQESIPMGVVYLTDKQYNAVENCDNKQSIFKQIQDIGNELLANEFATGFGLEPLENCLGQLCDTEGKNLREIADDIGVIIE